MNTFTVYSKPHKKILWYTYVYKSQTIIQYNIFEWNFKMFLWLQWKVKDFRNKNNINIWTLTHM